MKKLFIFLLATAAITAETVTIKNDTKTDYFIIAEDIGHEIEPQEEVQIEVQESSWLKSWIHDPSKITLFKKIGDKEGFVKTFEIKPNFKDNDSIVIFVSDVQRKARHVSAPFTVLNSTKTKED